MSQIIDLGKLRFSFAGDYNSATTYEFNDIVKYGGNVYVYTYALKASGHLPTDTTYWALMVEGIKFKGVYDNAYSYKVGDAVAHGGKVYIAVIDTTAHTPPNVTYWSQFADGIQYEGTFVITNQYQKNDIVMYGSSAYIALQDTNNNLPTVTAYWAKLVEGISASGAWSSTTAYVPNDLVAYGANQYKAIANNTNQLPINSSGVLNSTYWALITESIRAKGEWTTATEYYINDVIQHGGNSYIALTRHASSVFDTDLAANKWVKFNGGIRWRGAWSATTAYLKDDLVKDAVGSVYIANLDHTSASAFNPDLTANKWTQFVTGGSDVLPPITQYDRGQSLTVLGNGTGLDWIGATQSANTYYVAPHGVDAVGYGLNLSLPFASVKYACQTAATAGQTSTIYVKTGTYQEQLPIVVPPNTAIVGDSQRTVVINAKTGLSDDGITPNSQSTMFKMSNGSILNKMTFTGMTGWVPGTTAADITTSTIKGVVVALNSSSPITSKSPYVLECAAICQGAIGALVDGTTHNSGAKTMIFHGYTVITDNGVGYWIREGGKAEIVSCFTYYAYFGYASTGGGHIRALNGNNSYGTWGALAKGFNPDEIPITGTLVGQQLPFTYTGGNIQPGDTVTSSGGATATVTNVQYSSDKVYVKNITGTFTTNQTLAFSSGGTGTVKSGAENQKGFVLVAKGFSSLPKPGASISLTGDTYSYVIQSTTNTWTNSDSEIVLLLAQEKPSGSASGTTVTVRYKYSQIRLTGHDFLSIGTGGVATTNYPNTPTQPSAQGNEVEEMYPGRVFYVSTDQDGNFRVGEYFKIDQATGKATLNASAFDLSGLSSLRLGSIGAQLGEQINEFSSDSTLSGNSNLAVPTEYAVKTYIDAINTSVRAYVNTQIGNIQLLPTNNLGTQGFLVDTGGTRSWLSSDIVLDGAYPKFGGGTQTFSMYVGSQNITNFAASAGVGITVTHTLISGSLPSGLTLNSNGSVTGSWSSGSGTATFTVQAVAAGITRTKAFTWTYATKTPGQSLYGTNTGTGTFQWTAPSGVDTVSVVAVGGGGGSAQAGYWGYAAGGGGGLGWKNNITVVPGQSYTVVVGAGGSYSPNGAATIGSNSYFISTSTVAGYGGGTSFGSTSGPNQNTAGGGYGGGWVGDGGGAGGSGGSSYGGGGAAGYTGNGGNGPNGAPQTGGGGAYAGGSYSSTYGSGAGGGVGLYGKGSDGTGNYNPWQGWSTSAYSGGGMGGSGGTMGQYGENPYSGTGNYGPSGGVYGGGGGGPGSSWPGGYGGQGGVRIIWGQNRSFPSSGTNDQ